MQITLGALTLNDLPATGDNEEWTKDKLRWSSRSAVSETDVEA